MTHATLYWHWFDILWHWFDIQLQKSLSSHGVVIQVRLETQSVANLDCPDLLEPTFVQDSFLEVLR